MTKIPPTQAFGDAPDVIPLCPSCGQTVDASDDTFVCGECHTRARMSAGALAWQPSNGAEPNRGSSILWRGDRSLADNVRRWGRAIEFLANPFQNPASPAVWFARKRLDQYYARTLTDRALAHRWAEHYLGSIDAPGKCVLDHGAGRGRHLGILTQLGYKVSAQDIAWNPWWSRFPSCRFQIVPSEYSVLPWPTGSFDLVLDWMVIDHFETPRLRRLVAEIARVLKPGGRWLVLNANSTAFGARISRRQNGRLHALAFVRELAQSQRMFAVRQFYEGFRSPVLPLFVDAIRKQYVSRNFDLADYDSRLAQLVPDPRRALWFVDFQKG